MTHRLFLCRKLARVMTIGACSLSLVLLLALARTTVAQDEEADTAAAEVTANKTKPTDSDREPKPRRVESPVADPLSIPIKDDWRDERRRLDEKTLFAPPARGPSRKEQVVRMQLEKQLRQLERQLTELVKERMHLENELGRAMAQLEQAKPAYTEAQARKQHAMEEAEAAHAEMAALAAMQQMQQQGVPLPKHATTKVFSLRNSPATELARVLTEILGGRPMRIAVDERTNSLIVMADEETGKMVEALLLRLDQSIRDTKRRDQPGETLQLRIVWLLDGDLGMPPTVYVSPEVVEALQELGFKDPQVVCQQVATFTLSPNNREGQFDFHVPVLVKSQPWQFQGQGQVQPTGEERFNLRFDLRFSQVDRSSGRTRSGESGQLGGSIHTPLGHYTVMGTTTFVTAVPVEGFTSGGPKKLEPRQHLSAFVVYLDRAREFPATGAQSQNRDDR